MRFRSLYSFFISNSSIFIFSLLFANFCNFVFNAYLGRVLSFEDFGLVTLVVTIWNLMNIPLGALATTVNHRVAFLHTREGNQASSGFMHHLLKRTFIFVGIFSFLWIIFVPFLSYFFHVSPLVLWHITPAFFFGSFLFSIRGYFVGVSAFGIAGFFIALESLVKVMLGIIFSNSPFYTYTYVAIPLSVSIALIASLMFFYRVLTSRKNAVVSYRFSKRLFFTSLISGLSITTFLSFDVMLAKHYLDPVSAGQYAFLSLVGKMIFFFGSLLNGFVLTYVSQDIANERDPQKTFYRFLMFVVLLSVFAFLIIGLLGQFTLLLLFGNKVFVVLPYLIEYALAITLYTISSFIVLYHIARNHYSISFIPFLSSLVFVFGVLFFHSNIASIVRILFLVSTMHFFLVSLIHVLQRNGRFILRNLVDLLDIFSPKKKEAKVKKGKKRILIMNWRDMRHVYAGGAEVYIHEVAKRWVNDGHVVTIFCGNDSISPRNEYIDGIEVIRRGGFYFVYLWAFLYYLKKFRGRYDVIIDCHNGVPFFTPLYAKEQIICLVHHVHQEVFRSHLSPPFALLARILENRCMPLVYKDIPFIAVSPSTKKDMTQWGITGKGITVIPSGIDSVKYRPGKKSKYLLIIYVGRLKRYKSLDVFIKTAIRIHRRYLSAKFVIAGDGDDKKRLLSLVHRLRASSYIEFRGKVSEEEKISLYQRAWVCVHPSRLEGWGITTIEANACGTPVVASNVPGLRDSVVHGKTGVLVPYGDIDAFSKAISKLIANRQYRKDMEQLCLAWAKQFDWDKTASAFLNYIDAVISESSSWKQARNEQSTTISFSKRSPAFSEVEAV